MIFASSDIASLLHRWEIAEYVSEGFVIVGCAGELVADFFTRLPENIRKHIGNWSTIVLILALSIGLKCLIRTNELSGSVIGSLGDKATVADGKAGKAISDSSAAFSQATDALTSARKAEESLGKTENEASSAQRASSNALSLAHSARREADSFEKDIVSAKAQAAEANEKSAEANERSADAELHLADALKQASDATAELNRLKSPRILMNASEFSSRLKEFAGTEYTFPSVFGDAESEDLLKQIDSALQLAGWKRVKPSPPPIIGLNVYEDFRVAVGTSTGVEVAVGSAESVASLDTINPQTWPAVVKAAGTLKNALAVCITPTEGNVLNGLVVDSGTSVIRITVGKKP
jgi:hypothetical protein